MKLYALHLMKGDQLYEIGDNIKDHLDDKDDFKWHKKLLDWGVDFSDDIIMANDMVECKKGYRNWKGGWIDGKPEEELINESIVICNGKGTIKGIIELNKNNREKLKEQGNEQN